MGLLVAALVDGCQGAVGRAAVGRDDARVEAVVSLGQIGVHGDGLVCDAQVTHLIRAIVGTSGEESGCLGVGHKAAGSHRQGPVFANLRLKVESQRVAVVGEVVDVAFLSHVAQRAVVGGSVVSTLHRQRVLGVGSCAEDLVDVVDIVISIAGVAIANLVNHALRIAGYILCAIGDHATCQLVHQVGHVVVVHKLACVHKLGEVGIVRATDLTVVGDCGRALGSLLGGDDDDTAARLQAIDSRGAGVLEDRHALDVVGIDLVDATGYAVDDVGHRVDGATDAQRGLVLARLT